MAEDTEYPNISSSKQVHHKQAPHLTVIPIQPHTKSHRPSHTSLPVKNMTKTQTWTWSYSIQVKDGFSSNALDVQM